ncbi:hypothetical protein RJ640_019516 [Escallonia rubra]|uniref:Dilute domain-containing protein n=1 Tax=Escallonia rubra TaxID=112253 RepID=A0AA88UDZ2_9ASTE|nr:hypothetical protein RJ640_019516 [Escallonia rubra]
MGVCFSPLIRAATLVQLKKVEISMKETGNKRTPNNNQAKSFAKSERREHKLQDENAHKNVKPKEIDSKASSAKPAISLLVSDPNTGTDASEVVCEFAVTHCVDGVYRSEEASQDLKTLEMVDKENKNGVNCRSSDLEGEAKEGREEESDTETITDSVSSHGDSQAAEDEKVERAARVPKRLAKKDSSDSFPRTSRVKSDRGTKTVQIKASNNAAKKAAKSSRGPSRETTNSLSETSSRNMKVHPKPSSESSDGVEDKPLEEIKEVDRVDEASNDKHNGRTDDETVNAEENDDQEDKAALDRKVAEMEMRIDKLEAELREVAALEISLYSVVPEHGSSAHKVHTPARRLSRLYIHACKHWSQDKRATVARNIVSGLVLIAKSCGSDVARLTFWLSNNIVLREIITQAFGKSCNSSSLTRIFESNGGGKKSEGKSALLKWKGSSSCMQQNKIGFMQFIDDWQATSTFTAALEKVESWIFSRMVESIWWQTLTPNMQSPTGDIRTNKTVGRLLGPALGDQQQGSFSINLWKDAFCDAFRRLCPVRAGGHECGCLPVMAKLVMEQCVSRLDVAMFNAILRESAHEIPTDPVSDPIVDSKVLPIPAGDLSFGSGAQLKNSVGNWSRWLSDLFGMDADNPVKGDQPDKEDNDGQGRNAVPKCFHLLNALSDLLMLPKDMLMDRSIRTEVCPSISIPLLKRILCNFTPDEFCPDPVPGAVLEALNAECFIERRFSGETASSFPYTASPVLYTPPSSDDVSEKVADAGGKSQLARNASIIQRKGYTSDEELEELDSPLTFIIEKFPSSPSITANGNVNGDHMDQRGYPGATSRYQLLREVWSA